MLDANTLRSHSFDAYGDTCRQFAQLQHDRIIPRTGAPA